MGDWGFGYDRSNRLTGAAAGNAPTTGSAPATWVTFIGCYNYDSFGNRTVAAITTTGDCSSVGAATASYTSCNKVCFVSQAAHISYSAPSGFTYDAGGNVLADGQNTTLATVVEIAPVKALKM